MRTRTGWMLAIGVLFAGCGTTTPKSGEAVVARPASALAVPVVLLASEATVEARRGEEAFAALEKGKPIAQVTAIRTTSSGAVLQIGDKKGKLWLKAHSSVDVGQDDHGRLRVLVAEGEARLEEDSSDVLLRKKGDSTVAVLTAKNVEAADWSLALEAKKDTAGIGAIETRGEGGQKARLELRSLKVLAKPAGDFAETTVDHVFYNDSDQRLEGTFRFPLPDDALLVGLSMEIDGKMMDGELVEREKARKTFEKIVDEMQDPALLEWEQGSVFKLRVFPIEPKKEKRVVLRYVAPLHRGLDGLELLYPTSAPGMQQRIGSFRLDFAGKTVIDEKNFAPGKDIVVPVAERGAAYREVRADGIYTAVRVRPDWSKIDGAPSVESPRPSRRVIAVVDTSRSSLEERALELDSLRMLLDELRPEDRFVTIASDIDARAETAAFVSPSADSIASSVKFIQSIDPDGASNLAAAIDKASKFADLARAAKDSATIEVVYIGDGTATWGETDPAALEKLAKQALGDASFYGVVLGKSADSDLVRQLSLATGGRTFRPRTPLQARRFALVLGHAAEVRRLSHVHLDARQGDLVFPAGESTIYEGDELVTVIRTPAGQPPPDAVKLTGTYAGRPFTEIVPIAATLATPYVAQRWATQEIAALDRALEPKKDAIVKLSLDFGIMSKYTSFLVLESEEAYAKYDIERKQGAQARAKSDGADPHVTGADLESVNGRSASLSPDRLQPGDPEIHIPAPPDAKSVVVVFPFGETKVATFEHGGEGNQGSWMVRFLIDRDTPDGTYEVTVRVTHADDSIEVMKLNYVVDTMRPTMSVTMKPARNQPGTYEIHATQVITETEITSAIPHAHGTLGEMQKRYAQILTDAKRVEVRLPDGEVLPLTAIRLGEFRGFWKPQAPLAGPVTLHVVAVDRALNQSAFDVVTP